MIRSLAWKEYREGRTIWLALALLGVGAVYVLPVFLDIMGQTDPGQQRTGVVVALLVLAVTYGIVAGSMLLAGEREAQTLTFLDVLTASRPRLWWSKLLVGVMLALTQGLVLAVVFRVGAPEAASRGPTTSLTLLLPCLTLEALAWGLFGSAFCGTVLASAGTGAALCALSWVLVAGYATAAGRSVYLPARLLADGLALFGSYSAFCHRSQGAGVRSQESGVRSQESGVRSQELAAVPSSLTPDSRLLTPALWWLVWRQGRDEFVVVATGVFVLGLGFASNVAMLWPLTTLLVGVIYGTGVWSREQADASYRFLSNQRLPPGRVWLVKTSFAALAALASVALGLLGAAVHVWLAYARQPDTVGPLLVSLRLDAVLFRGNSPAVALVWLAHGFAAGQLLGMACRKNLVATMMSLPVALMLVGVWLPSLLGGGLPAWQIYVVPVLLLVACRLLLWPWATDNLLNRRGLRTLTACAGVAACAVVGCLAYRVLGVPDVRAPFDVPQFTASLRDPNRLESGQRVRQALAEFAAQRRAAGSVRLPQTGAAASEDVRNRILAQGWKAPLAELDPVLAAQFENVLTQQFQGDWFGKLEKSVAGPPGLLFDLRQTPGYPALAELCDGRAPMSLALRSLQLLEQGHPRESLRCLKVLLGLSRTLRNKAVPLLYLSGEAAEELALRALEYWRARSPGNALLGEALRELDRHEAETPPPSDALAADYLGAQRRMAEAFQELAGEGTTPESEAWRGQLFTLAQLTPWERLRAERLINLAYAGPFAGKPAARSAAGVWESVLVSPGWRTIQARAEKGRSRLRVARLQLILALFGWKG